MMPAIYKTQKVGKSLQKSLPDFGPDNTGGAYFFDTPPSGKVTMMATDDRDVQDAAEVHPRDPADVEAEDDQPMAPPVMPMIAVGFPPVIGAASAAAGGLARPTEGIAPLAAGAAAFGAVGPLPLHGDNVGATAERFESALAADGRLGPGTANNVRFDIDDEGN